MKNQNQVGRKNSTTRQRRQPEIPAELAPLDPQRELKPPAEPGIDRGSYNSSEPVCLILFDHRADATLAGCGITPAQVSALQRKAKAAGKPIGYLLSRAVDTMVAS